MAKKVIGAILFVIAVLAGLAMLKVAQFKAMAKAGEAMAHMPPVTVNSAKVIRETWQPTLGAVGSISAVQGVMVRSEQSGIVKAIHFESGTTAAKDQLLVELDTGAEQAQLRSAEADAELADSELARATDLQARKVTSQAAWDAAAAKQKQAKAQVENIKEQIQKKNIKTPFAGRIGIRQVNLGQFLSMGDPIVELQSMDPVYADFSLPQQQLAALQNGMAVRVTSDSFPGKEFKGSLTAINSAIDAQTRSVKLQATLENADSLLRPGMFVKVEAVLPDTRSVLMVPATAILYAPYGDSVFVIEDQKDEATGKTGKVLRQQFIRTGMRQGDFVEVTSGLSEGQEVAGSGVFKLRNGSPAVVDNKLAPNPQLAPSPSDS